MKKIILSLVASLAFASAANAAVFDGDVSFDTAINMTNPGLQAKAVSLKNSGPQGFTSADLDFELAAVGDSFSIDLFVVRTLQAVVAADDLVAKAFALVFDFGVYGIATVTGTTYAVDDGTNVYGVLDFDDTPVTIALGNAQELVITLADQIFNIGVGGFTPGKSAGAVASVTFELAAVPLPATLPLGLGAIGLLGLVARRRKAVSQA